MSFKKFNGGVNLRGMDVFFDYRGRTVRGRAVTHIRNNYWAIDSPALPPNSKNNPWAPRRIILHRDQFAVA